LAHRASRHEADAGHLDRRQSVLLLSKLRNECIPKDTESEE
jgi:hypothetical protein